MSEETSNRLITDEEAVAAWEAVQEYGSQYAAAEALGISRPAIQRRLKKFYRNPELSALYKSAKEARVPLENVKAYWVKTDDVSMYVSNDKEMSYEQIRNNMIAEMKQYAPQYKDLSKEHNKNADNLLIIDPADPHFGKLCVPAESDSEYNLQVAQSRLEKGVSSLLNKACNFGLRKTILVIGNDILHIDNAKRTTTSGTGQDTDGQWWQMFLAGKMAYIKAIEEITRVSPVEIVFCPSNHDYVSGFMLADTIYSWFHRHPNVSFGINNMNISINHRKYVRYGNNLMGFTHGDGAKEVDLKNLMQIEARQDWAAVQHSVWYVHHYHHKIRKLYGLGANQVEKDNIGIARIDTGIPYDPESTTLIEYVRSPSPPDGWHHRNGYVNKQAIEAFMHHYWDGPIARFTEYC